jgi:hypothetical protein
VDHRRGVRVGTLLHRRFTLSLLGSRTSGQRWRRAGVSVVALASLTQIVQAQDPGKACAPGMVCRIPRYNQLAPSIGAPRAPEATSPDAPSKQCTHFPIDANPTAILRERARLDDVLASGATPGEQARTACLNLIASTYRAFDGKLTTSFVSGRSLRVRPFFSVGGCSYIQMAGVTETPLGPAGLGGADALNNIRYKQSVSFKATAYRTGSDRDGWTPWKDDLSGQTLADCYYEIHNDGDAAIGAVDFVTGLSLSQLEPPTNIPAN